MQPLKIYKRYKASKMGAYDPQAIEPKWQRYWKEQNLHKVVIDKSKPKYYVLDMFPYPSGAGLHIGHPLGYIASDIVSRFKRLKGFNVLHPMGFDSFGLPAEQYAIETGQHPATTTSQNIDVFKKQLNKIGLCFDWSREIQTADPKFYKWTQWMFQLFFNAWFDKKAQKAKPIADLVKHFAQWGTENLSAACSQGTRSFTPAQWEAISKVDKQRELLKYRLTYPAEALVNWCPTLGTVLANDEVKDGFSERGGHPVVRKKMKQWMMRITAYAERLLKNLPTIDWSEALKNMQENWIGKSSGCELDFQVVGQPLLLSCFTTRPDTIFGVTYIVIAPEHKWVIRLTTDAQRPAVEQYLYYAQNRSERERLREVKKVSGVFTGTYLINPISEEKIPLWVADYVLASYGTGIVMAVPSSDNRDFCFAKHFNLPIKCIIEGTENMLDPTQKKDGKLINSGFLNGMMGEKIDDNASEGVGAKAVIEEATRLGLGRSKINYKMRDAVFSRQRYWGEPMPVFFDENQLPQLVPSENLPLLLPKIDQYLPTPTGDPPLGRAKHWKYQGKFNYELTTMPCWAGENWYFLRYMDAHNEAAFVSKEAGKLLASSRFICWRNGTRYWAFVVCPFL